MSTDEPYARELRALADATVPGAHIAGATALVAVKRRTRARRARQAVLSVVGAAVIGAGAIGLSTAQTTGVAIVPAEPTATTSDPAADIDLTPAPGITQMPSDARTYERHDGVTLVDSGLESWVTGERFVFALHPAPTEEDPPPQVGVYSVTNVELAALIDDPTLPDAEWATFAFSPQTMQSDDGAHSLLFSWTHPQPWRVALSDYVPLPDGTSMQSFPAAQVQALTATGWGTTFDLFAARFDANRGDTLPAARALVHFTTAEGVSGAGDCTRGTCTVVWDGESVTPAPAPLQHPATTAAAEALAAVESFDRFLLSGDDILTTCTDARAVWEEQHEIIGRAVDRTTQCYLDALDEYDRRIAAQENGS